MKIGLIFGMIALFVFVSFTQTIFAIETEQEPGPPQIPEPSPAPDPFPEKSNSEKIKRLTEENDNLK